MACQWGRGLEIPEFFSGCYQISLIATEEYDKDLLQRHDLLKIEVLALIHENMND